MADTAPQDAAENLVDVDHALVEHLMVYRRPSDADQEIMASLRGNFIDLGHTVVALVPRTPDRTVALRKIHEALMATIAALALNPTEG